jgi:Putative auto-transporter adhesin, head GIN domain
MKSNFNRKVSLLLLAFATLFILPSCEKIIGKGPVVTENRNASAFEKLAVSVDAETHFTQDNSFKLEIDAQQNILDEIETVVINNELKIRFRHPNVRIRNSDRIVIRVSAPQVTSFQVNGSGDMDIVQPNAPASVYFAVSGSGNITADKAGISYVESTISGSGKIIIHGGTPNEEKISISGSGYVDMQDVMVKDANTHISGSGTIKLYATDKLDAHISGSGTVFYKGIPAITSSVSGSGSVVKL